MDFMDGDLLRMIFHHFDLSLPVFRGSKGSIRKKLPLQYLRRPLHIHRPLVSANAVVMWCMECIWISYCMRLLDRAPICMGARGFTSSSLLHLHKSRFVPFLFYSWVRLFSLILWLSMCLLCVCVCCVVWWGSSLSGSSRGWW